MDVRVTKICALVLALAIVPGFAEILDSGVHFLTEGHMAHGQPDGDQHQPAGPEHGCSTTFHLCSCHASLTFLPPASPPRATLRLTAARPPSAPVWKPIGSGRTIDRPPRS